MIYTLTLNPALDMELTVNHLEIGQVHRASKERYDVGGKGFNVSRVLNVLGVENVAVGVIAGATGRRLAKGLSAEGIRADLFEIPGETRTNISIVGNSHQEYIKVNQAGAPVSAGYAEKLLDKSAQITQRGDLWVISGSLPPGMPEDFYASMITRINAQGGQAILDASGAALACALKAGVRLVKPNAEEAAGLIGKPVGSVEDALEAAEWILALGVEAVVISLGGSGLVAADKTGKWVARLLDITPHNPVGAGDALVAGLAAAFDRGEDLSSAIQLGTACGASAASQPGTGIGSKAEIAALQQLVIVERVK